MLDHNHTGGAEAVRGETLGDHLVGMYVCSIILGQPQGTCPGVHTPRGYRYGLGPGHLGVYPCPSLLPPSSTPWALSHLRTHSVLHHTSSSPGTTYMDAHIILASIAITATTLCTLGLQALVHSHLLPKPRNIKEMGIKSPTVDQNQK